MSTPADIACPLRQLLAEHAPAGFDWPCACQHTSDQCTKRSDGTCDG